MNPNITPQEPIQELEIPNRDIEQKSQPKTQIINKKSIKNLSGYTASTRLLWQYSLHSFL